MVAIMHLFNCHPLDVPDSPTTSRVLSAERPELVRFPSTGGTRIGLSSE
jgi:hypothetical protein